VHSRGRQPLPIIRASEGEEEPCESKPKRRDELTAEIRRIRETTGQDELSGGAEEEACEYEECDGELGEGYAESQSHGL
jgi:hypothetical protein